ncbi:MAG: hypothetical protein KME06_14095 [Kastovskya adunca ATA6-11-RM4]|jgi:transposase|nr:hypothetical protein [Kastovskya adunca ATA6-11-RM4]
MSRLPEIANPNRQPYASDLSDAEWEILQPLLPKAKGFGRPSANKQSSAEISASICALKPYATEA